MEWMEVTLVKNLCVSGYSTGLQYLYIRLIGLLAWGWGEGGWGG